MRPDTIKPLEEKGGRTLSDINCSNIFFDSPPRIMEIKTKLNKWNLFKSFLHSKGNNKQNENTTHRLGENICEWCDWQGISLQNLQIIQASKQTIQSTNGKET